MLIVPSQCSTLLGDLDNLTEKSCTFHLQLQSTQENIPCLYVSNLYMCHFVVLETKL
jgi:hypothetical protein